MRVFAVAALIAVAAVAFTARSHAADTTGSEQADAGARDAGRD